MGPHKTHRQEERPVLQLFDQLHRLGRGFSIRVDQVITFGFHHHKSVASHNGPLAVRVALQGLTLAGCFPFGPRAVVPLTPGKRIVCPVASFLDATRHAHVKHFAHSRGVVAVVLEVLRPGRAIADGLARCLVPQDSRGVGIVARQERSP